MRQNYNLSLCDLTLSASQFILKTSLLIIVLYYQTKTPIGFLCRRWLNSKFLIQLSETLPFKLTETYYFKNFQLIVFHPKYPNNFLWSKPSFFLFFLFWIWYLQQQWGSKNLNFRSSNKIEQIMSLNHKTLDFILIQILVIQNIKINKACVAKL